MNKLIPGAALALSLAFAGTAQAAPSDMQSFDGLTPGTIDSQAGWTVGAKYDTEVTSVDKGQAFRVSNAVTDGSFADMPFSAPVDKASEKVGISANNRLTNEFTIKSVTGTYQPGLAMSVSPTGAGGSRMSYIRFEDSYDGIRVFFRDVAGEPAESGLHSVLFTEKQIATLSHDRAHSIKFDTTFIPGFDNDVVRVSIDGTQKVCGGSWEEYYRFAEGHEPTATDRMMWRLNLPTSNPVAHNGYLFDNVKSESSHVSDPEGCALPVGPKGDAGKDGKDGKDGANGTNGTNGVDGKNGANGSNGVNGAPGATGPAGASGTTATAAGVNGAKVKIGATKRTLHVPSVKGMKLVGVRASLRGKHLPVHGQSIKVDLRDKVVGNYNVTIVAKYKTKSGKTHTVRSIRGLSITLR
jgi:hypothetical protein